MACYQCGAPEGSEAQLCKACQTQRSVNYQTIREKLLVDRVRWKHYWTIIKEEWYLGVALIILMFFALYLIIGFLRRPHEVKIGPGTNPEIESLTAESATAESTLKPTYTSEQVYESCLTALQKVDTSTLDVEAVTNAYRDTYKKELEELDRQNPKDADGKPLTLFARILLIRAQESCQEAKLRCEADLLSTSCKRFAAEYLKESEAQPL
jgi:hypothetical protein